MFVEPFIEHQGERRGLWLRKPRPAGEKLLIAGRASFVPPSPGGRSVVLLGSGRAFGTGGHGTTEGCLLALEKCIRGGESVLDVGTGTGILAVAACRLGAGRATAVDIDRAACLETARNAALNGLSDRIDVVAGDIGSVGGRFDLVVANLRTPLLARLMDAMEARLADGGTAIFSGILERELHPFLSVIARYPFDPPRIGRAGGWVTLATKKRGE